MNRKRMLSVAVLVVLAALLTGCAPSVTKDIQIETDADPKANFNGYKTYAWLGSAAILNDPHGQWEPQAFDADSEIKFLLDRELRKRGLSVNNSTPDLIVAFAAGIDMEALGLKEDPETKEDVVVNLPQGGLLVAFVDAETGFVIWAGAATGEIQDKPAAETVKKRLDYAVTQMIKQVPK